MTNNDDNIKYREPKPVDYSTLPTEAQRSIARCLQGCYPGLLYADLLRIRTKYKLNLGVDMLNNEVIVSHEDMAWRIGRGVEGWYAFRGCAGPMVHDVLRTLFTAESVRR